MKLYKAIASPRFFYGFSASVLIVSGIIGILTALNAQSFPLYLKIAYISLVVCQMTICVLVLVWSKGLKKQAKDEVRQGSDVPVD